MVLSSFQTLFSHFPVPKAYTMAGPFVSLSGDAGGPPHVSTRLVLSSVTVEQKTAWLAGGGDKGRDGLPWGSQKC